MKTRSCISCAGRCGMAMLLVLSVASCFRPDAMPGGRSASGAGPDSVGLSTVPAQRDDASSEISLAVRVFLKPLPDRMPGSQKDTPEKAALGRKLFFERGISQSQTQSCNDCHCLDRQQAGVDCNPTSKGAKGAMGNRNSPTVLNAGFHAAQFWDGRAADLEAQAKGPILNPVEMAMASPADVETWLKGNKEYQEMFAKAFPGEADAVTFDNLAVAIAAFERTLVAPGRFDRYLKGNLGALTADEKRGLTRFTDTGCIECHNGYAIGGRLFEKVGVYHPYANQGDLGRFGITGKEDDRYVFKVPSLRNVTLTPPYFHDGKVATLEEAIPLMARIQLDKNLTAPEVAEIVVFLRTLESERPVGVAGQ